MMFVWTAGMWFLQRFRNYLSQSKNLYSKSIVFETFENFPVLLCQKWSSGKTPCSFDNTAEFINSKSNNFCSNPKNHNFTKIFRIGSPKCYSGQPWQKDFSSKSKNVFLDVQIVFTQSTKKKFYRFSNCEFESKWSSRYVEFIFWNPAGQLRSKCKKLSFWISNQ